MRTLATTAALAAAALAVGAAAPAAATTTETDITVVHGLNIPGIGGVDVFVDGELGIPDFAFGDIAETSLAPGEYLVSICLAGTCDENLDAAVLEDLVTVSDQATTLVAQLDEAGTPLLRGYADDRSEAPAGQGVLLVRHAAAAPAVDITANGTPVISGLVNGGQEQVAVPAGAYDIETSAGGAVVDALSEPGFTVDAGVLSVVYAVGNAQVGYELLVDDIEIGEADPQPGDTPSDTPSATPSDGGEPGAPGEDGADDPTGIPTAVPAGEALVADRGPGAPAAWLAVALAAAAAATTAALGLARRRTVGARRG